MINKLKIDFIYRKPAKIFFKKHNDIKKNLKIILLQSLKDKLILI